MSYAYSTGSFPVPLGPSPTVIGGGSSGTFNSGMVSGVSNNLNQLAAASLAGINSAGGAYGVVSGLTLSTPGTLNIVVAPGLTIMDTPLELVASGAYGTYQANVPSALTLPISATSFVWLTSAGALASSTSTTPPTGGKVFLGIVVTNATVVTTIDYSGVVHLTAGAAYRNTNDAWAPSDSPGTGVRVTTLTQTGSYLWDGSTHRQLVGLSMQMVTPYKIATLSADYTIGVNDPNLLILTPSGANRNVNFPDPTTVSPGHTFKVQNPAGSGHSLVLKDHSGGTMATMTAGQEAIVAVAYSSGANTFPSTVTPLTAGTATA